jgi:hypothetical protein
MTIARAIALAPNSGRVAVTLGGLTLSATGIDQLARGRRVRRPALVTRRDIATAIKAAQAAGITVARIEVDPSGRIIIIAARPGQLDDTAVNEWDSVIGGDR